MAILTQNMVLSRTRKSRLSDVTNLNICGNELDDLTILRDMPNLTVLSLSVNSVTTLQWFANCPKLTELYLRSNKIRDINEIAYLRGLKSLRKLWLIDNPCTTTPSYRRIVIGQLPHLVNLDQVDVTDDERGAAMSGAPAAYQPPSIQPAHNSYEPPQQVRPSVPVYQPQQQAPSSYQQVPQPQKNMPNAAYRPEPIYRQNPSSAPMAKGTDHAMIACLQLLNLLDSNGLETVRQECMRRLRK